MHTTPGLLKVAQKMTKISGTTVTEFCKERIVATYGNYIYWFSSTTGKIWQQDPTTDTFTLIYTTVPTSGGAGCLGAIMYQGYLYWATQSYLHRVSLGGDVFMDAGVYVEPNWKLFSITDSLFHPMLELNQVLYIGDGNYVAQVDAGTFTADALDIATPLRIKSLGSITTDLLVGTWVSNNITQTELIRWNTYSVSFTTSDVIPETGINAFLPSDNFVLVQAGLAGNIYSYDGSVMSLYKTIPGEYSPTAYGYIHPSSVGNLNGQMLFGMSNGTGNPCDLGVYRIARHDVKYPFIMDFPYPISERSGSAFVTSSIEIGALAVSGFNVYVAWKNGTTYGVDKLDYSNKLNGAYFETRVMSLNREMLSTMDLINLNYYQMPSGCSIQFAVDKNYEGYVDSDTDVDSMRNTVSCDDTIECSSLSVKATFTTSSNDDPNIESGFVSLK
jgi:hypothetical protein